MRMRKKAKNQIKNSHCYLEEITICKQVFMLIPVLCAVRFPFQPNWFYTPKKKRNLNRYQHRSFIYFTTFLFVYSAVNEHNQ